MSGCIEIAMQCYLCDRDGARESLRQCPECWSNAVLQRDGWHRCERCGLQFRECLNGVA